MSIIDAHCHLANLADITALEPLLDEAEAKGITRFVSSALRKSEVAWHLQHPDSRIIFSAGIHPNFDECDLDMKDLKKLCDEKSIWAIGEIGLDNGNPEIAVQRKEFVQQLELAADYRLPVVLHIVGHQEEAYKTLKQYPLPYLVHGYAGSTEGFLQLKRLEAVFSISSRILKEEKLDLLTAMLNHKRILFETDITQYYVHEGESNPLLRLIDVVEKCSALSGISVPRLLGMQAVSARFLWAKN
ncbi:MAG: TatD family deoxyribonuclease [Candidatus Cloacimonetes bacterium HGW-Cloacimonetes-3]|jgi:TatD DNase family protein|nr:MAG: TatD family deoxyribonuclease [Candidatus Cloacimonetes bacterium HGW-Cloacimonetes-3]